MSTIFHPWVGQNYRSGGIFPKKIMVLGDSHYGSEPKSWLTQMVMEWYLDQRIPREPWMNTFLKFERSLVGHETTPEESKEIWNSVMFYNYLQVLLSGPREEGTPKQYKDSEGSFWLMVYSNSPDVIIVWGKRLWKYLPWDLWTECDPVVVDGYEVDNGYYTLCGGKKVRVVCVYHPSVGYSWDFWHKVISRFYDFRRLK